VLRQNLQSLTHAAIMTCPESGIVLNVMTNEPGLQLYTGNFLDGTVTGKRGEVYAHRNAVCLETQKFPDSPNKPDWQSPILRPGEKYQSTTVFRFSTAARTE
jgi:aldose 1-epimerase